MNSFEQHKWARLLGLPAKLLGKFYVCGDSGCWIWQATKTKRGYGQINLDGKMRLAHRYAFAYSKGISERDIEVVRHKCDNPSCVNPEHLEEGTQADNLNDNYSRKGSRNLKLEQVLEIKERIKKGDKNVNIAQDYGVLPCIISHIRCGRTWSKYL